MEPWHGACGDARLSVPSVVGEAKQLMPDEFLISPFRPQAQESSERNLGMTLSVLRGWALWLLVSQSEYRLDVVSVVISVTLLTHLRKLLRRSK